MKSFIAIGLGTVLTGAAVAQYPNTNAPLAAPRAMTVPVATLRQPVETAPAPSPWIPKSTTPTVPPASVMASDCASSSMPWDGGAACGTPLIAGGLKPGDRTTINRWRNWICYTPGPHAIPVMTPTPYHAPLRSYIPVKPMLAPAPYAAPTEKVPCFGFRLANAPDGDCRMPLLGGACSSRFGNGGLFVRSPGSCPVQGPVAYGHSPKVVPLLAKCSGDGCSTGFGRLGTLLDNCKHLLLPGRCMAEGSCGPYGNGGDLVPGCTSANCVPGGVPGPTLAGYRLACPVGYPAPMGAYPATPAYQQQIAKVPFTNP